MPYTDALHHVVYAEPAPASMSQQRPETSVHAGVANIPSSPVPSTVRVAQQTLRKRDFESELLDRLLNGQQASAPAQGEDARMMAQCNHR